MLNGYKTYIAATLAFAAAVYEVAVTNDMDKAFGYFVAGFALVGLRGAR